MAARLYQWKEEKTLVAEILFIDDEASFLMRGFIDVLEDYGHNVILAQDGEEALRHLKDRNYNFDLIIMDLFLPRGNVEDLPLIPENIGAHEMGIEILRQLREEMRVETPVIVLSAVGDNEVKTRVLEMGVKRVFTKPVSLRSFMDEVKRAIYSKKSLSEDNK